MENDADKSIIYEKMIEGIDSSKRGVSRVLADRLKAVLSAGHFQPGDRFPTVRQLMRQSQLRYGSVSRALGLLAEEGYLEQRQGSGTYVRQLTADKSLPRTAPRRIGVVLPYWASSMTQFTVGDLFQGISEQADKDHHRVELIHNSRDEASKYEFLDKIIKQGIDGVVWMQPVPEHEVNLARLLDRNMPVVATGRSFSRLPLTAVHENLDSMGRLVVAAMKRHHRRKMIVLSGPLTDEYSTKRIAALRRSLQAEGMELPDDCVCVAYSPDLNNSGRAYLVEAAVTEFLAQHFDFDTVFSLHPNHLGPVVKLHTEGVKRSPDDFLMIQMGPSQMPVAHRWPQMPIATIEWPLGAMGRQAVRVLEQQWGSAPTGAPEESLEPRLEEPWLQK